jgi:integrase
MSQPHKPPSIDRPSLKVFSPETPTEESSVSANATQPPAITTDLTLSQIYETAFVPLWCRPRSLARKNELIYEGAIAWWKRLTGDPPLKQIDDFTTSRFVELLIQQKGRKRALLATATVRKVCGRIDHLLSFIGPKRRDRTGRKNLGLLDLPPAIEMPEADREPPHGDFTLAEVRAMWQACDRMSLPNNCGGVPASLWWRALLTVGVRTGLRIGEMMRLEYLDLAPPYIQVWAKNAKGRRGKKQYLTGEVLDAINAIRTPRRLIFECTWQRNPRWYLTLFKRLAEYAGLPADRRFGFHGLRKCHASLIAAEDQDGVAAAQASLGHTSSSTTRKHYVNAGVQDRIAAAAIERMPSMKPAQMSDDSRQMKLF